jgi:hypothetical protein
VPPDASEDGSSLPGDDIDITDEDVEGLDDFEEGSTEAGEAVPPTDDGRTLLDVLTAALIVVALTGGIAGVVVLLKALFGRTLLQEAAARRAARAKAASFRDFEATHVIGKGVIINVANPPGITKLKKEGVKVPPSLEAPLPIDVKPIPPVDPTDDYYWESPWRPAETEAEITIRINDERQPGDPNVILRTGAPAFVPWEYLTPLYPPARIRHGNVEEDTGALDVDVTKGGVTATKRLRVGWEGRIIERRGSRVLFRYGQEEVWIDSRYVELTPSASASAEFTPSAPPPPPAVPPPPAPPEP